ncbi:MAG: type II toxin-antitoxin system death-on-curing family toxin [Acidobacteria bacterium]|nr:type II toxin-antitoxin system death-on-curing family toxin [Acidobacteriota bacterium]
MEIAFLTMEDVLALHDELIQRYGGSSGLRDAGLLEAALAMPQAGFGGQYFHEFPHEMGAAYLFHLVRNHAFTDGNKRVALACAILFFKINRVTYTIKEDEAVKITYAAASGQMNKSDVTEFFRRHLKIYQSPD